MFTLPDLQSIFKENPEWKHAWEIIHKEKLSLNLTGKAGTGKSTFIHALRAYSDKKILYTAPTGLAALNIRGVTLHSLFGIPFGPILPNDDRLLNHRLNATKKRLLNKAEILVIDEISMVRADVLDTIDFLLRRYVNVEKPFAGKQIILVGDNFQLEPIAQNEDRDILMEYYDHLYYFASKAYQSIEIENVELKIVYRQTDDYFISLLNKFRIGAVNPNDLDELNTRVATNELIMDSQNFSIVLAPRSATVAAENLIKLSAIEEPSHNFKAIIKGQFKASAFPTDENLELKVGAQIILVKNDKNKKWVNGSLGKIKHIADDALKVELESGKTVLVTPEEWEQIEYKYDTKTKSISEEIIGTFRQFPVRLAWAITIHKSQGLTFNQVTLNMSGGAFAAGQLYVALSRCRSLEGLVLKQKVKNSDILVKREALIFSGLGKYSDYE